MIEDDTCESVIIPVNINHSTVYGKMNAYQRGFSGAFTYNVENNSSAPIESPCVSAVSHS